MNSSSLHLLLSDDDLDDCLFFEEALGELPVSATLTIVNDGVELMKLLSAVKQPLPHVLYLDLNMPRKNGFECLVEIKQNEILRQLPVIIFSTSFDSNAVNLLYEQGANYYICKPTNFSQLKTVIAKSIDLISETNNVQVSKNNFVLSV